MQSMRVHRIARPCHFVERYANRKGEKQCHSLKERDLQHHCRTPSSYLFATLGWAVRTGCANRHGKSEGRVAHQTYVEEGKSRRSACNHPIKRKINGWSFNLVNDVI